MKIAILGGGWVAQTFGSRLIALGHRVQLGIRNPDRGELARPRDTAVPLAEWVAATGGTVATCTGAAAFGRSRSTQLPGLDRWRRWQWLSRRRLKARY